MDFTKHLFREDKLIVAVKHETSEDYINKLLSGKRPANTDRAKEILNDLELLANENMVWRISKVEELGVNILQITF